MFAREDFFRAGLFIAGIMQLYRDQHEVNIPTLWNSASAAGSVEGVKYSRAQKALPFLESSITLPLQHGFTSPLNETPNLLDRRPYRRPKMSFLKVFECSLRRCQPRLMIYRNAANHRRLHEVFDVIMDIH